MKKSIIAATMCAAIAASAVPFAGAANTVTATPTRDMGQTVYVNDTRVYPTGYNIANNNYFKLRDIGALVGFGVEWNSATQTVEISTERTAPSTAGIQDEAVNGAVAIPSGQKITVDGAQVNMTAYQIGGSNYVKLRDIGQQIDFNVTYDSATGSVRVDTDTPYAEPASGSAITKWNKTMAEFNQAMIDCNWDKAKYLTTAKRYAPAITGKAGGTVEDVIATLDAMTGAPVDAVSFDDNPVNMFWANELRKALGQEVISGSDNDDTPAVTEEMLRAWELEMVDAVNEERRKASVAELEIDPNIMQRAQWWAKHLTTEFRHTTWDEIEEFADSIGVSANDIAGGENITGGSSDLNNVVGRHMNNFMTSEGHRNTLLDKDFTRIGIGYAVGSTGSIYCCQVFA